MAIPDWMPTLVSKLGEVAGLAGGVRYYADLPAAILETPLMLVTTLSGRDSWSAGRGSVCVHQVQATLFLTSQFLPEAHSVAVPFIKLVRDKLAANIQLGGLVDSVGPSEEGPFYDGPGRVTYGRADGTEQEFTAIVFRLQVKDTDTLTVSA